MFSLLRRNFKVISVAVSNNLVVTFRMFFFGPPGARFGLVHVKKNQAYVTKSWAMNHAVCLRSIGATVLELFPRVFSANPPYSAPF